MTIFSTILSMTLSYIWMLVVSEWSSWTEVSAGTCTYCTYPGTLTSTYVTISLGTYLVRKTLISLTISLIFSLQT